ncbi:MAG TPA: Ig-like domain-containing protein, partial [Gemmatimonadaceae bacterium]|nr:Ig-like domain-containing protein [Gemmatimonadaceae bacterium]
MRLSTLVAAVALAAPLSGASLAAQDTLRVLYHTAGDTVSPSSIVTVMFDRPIAGAPDSTVSASRVFHIEPAVAGSAVWRDPVTIRLVPTATLTPGTVYTVTLENVIRAADGATLGAPYQFRFRVVGSRLVGRSFDRNGPGGDTLAPDGRIQLLYSAPVDEERIQRQVRLELSGCPSADTIAYRATRQRKIGQGDPDYFRWAGGYSSDTLVTGLRRVVELEPVKPLPLECAGRIVVPTTTDDSVYGRLERYAVRTAPTFRILTLDCRDENPYDAGACNKKVLTLWLSSPIRRGDVAHFVRLNDQPVAYEGRSEVGKQWSLPVRLTPRTTYRVHLDTAMRDVYGRRLDGPTEIAVVTGDFAPEIAYPTGIITAPYSGPRTLPLRFVNVQSVRIIAFRIPDSSRASALRPARPSSLYQLVRRGTVAETSLVALPARLNLDTTIAAPIPAIALAPDHPLVALRIEVVQPLAAAHLPDSSRFAHALVLVWPGQQAEWWSGFMPLRVMLLQVTDLSITARLVGVADGAAMVTDLANGRPRANVSVTQTDPWGREVGRGVTDREGLAVLARVAPDSIPPARTPTT